MVHPCTCSGRRPGNHRQSVLSSLPHAIHPQSCGFISDRVSNATPLSITGAPPSSCSEAFLVCVATRVSHTVCVSKAACKGDAFRIKVLNSSVHYKNVHDFLLHLEIKIPTTSQPTDKGSWRASSLAAPHQPPSAVSLPRLA